MKGIIATLRASDGRFIASASDSDPETFGHYSTRQSQEIRSRRKLEKAALAALCAPDVADILEPTLLASWERIIDALVKHKGNRVEIKPAP
jgi:hypothetical protein